MKKYQIYAERREMNKLEDIFVKHNYSVEKIDGKMVATLARGGRYRATSAKDVELALTDGSQVDTVLVRTSTKTKWTSLPRAMKVLPQRGII